MSAQSTPRWLCARCSVGARPVVVVAENKETPKWNHVSALPNREYVLPAVELAGGTIISESVYTPIAREDRQDLHSWIGSSAFVG